MTFLRRVIVATARTACARRESTASKASSMPEEGSVTADMRSFSKQTTRFACWRKASSASSACSRRRFPSKEKGSVANTTTWAPCARIASAIQGAAPEPVPPPSPTSNTTSDAPSNRAPTTDILSCAAARPSSGSPPVPRPRVSRCPSTRRSTVAAVDNARESVLATRISIPGSPSLVSRSAAWLPAPPTPKTLTFHSEWAS